MSKLTPKIVDINLPSGKQSRGIRHVRVEPTARPASLGTSEAAPTPDPFATASRFEGVVDEFEPRDSDLDFDGNDYTYPSGFLLNRETGELRSWSTHRANLNSNSTRVAYGLDKEFEFPFPLCAEDKFELVDSSNEDLRLLIAGFESGWDGNNFVDKSRYDDDSIAALAVQRIEERLDASEGLSLNWLESLASADEERNAEAESAASLPEGTEVKWSDESNDYGVVWRAEEWVDFPVGNGASASKVREAIEAASAEIDRSLKEQAECEEEHEAESEAESRELPRIPEA